MTLQTGKRPATYDKRDLRFANIRPKTGTLPVLKNQWGGGFGTDFPDWRMLGNGPCDDGSITSGYAADGAGNCVFAGKGHELMELGHNAKRTVPSFTCKTVLDQYAQYLGLASAADLNANNDQGTDVREALSRHQKQGFKDDAGHVYKIGTYISLELGNFQELYEALVLFENVGIGVNFPNSAMDQFNAGQIWSVVNGAQVEGGHYIPLVGHPTKNIWTCVTWGRRQLITPQFLTQYMDEAWAYIDPERYNQVTGLTFEGYKDVDLERYITMFLQSN